MSQKSSTFGGRKVRIILYLWSNLQVMKKEIKEMLESMINAWGYYNQSKRVTFKMECEEFSRGHWSMDLRCSGVINPEFMAFLLPALSANDCIWFLSGIGNDVIFHIQ